MSLASAATSLSSTNHLLPPAWHHEDSTPETQSVRALSSLNNSVYSSAGRYTNGNETYTFVPAEPVGARSLTIYRNSGDIVLNRELSYMFPLSSNKRHIAPNTPLPATSERSGKTIYGILGMVTLVMCTSVYTYFMLNLRSAAQRNMLS